MGGGLAGSSALMGGFRVIFLLARAQLPSRSRGLRFRPRPYALTLVAPGPLRTGCGFAAARRLYHLKRLALV